MTSASGGGRDTLGPEVRLTDWDVVSLLHGAQRPYNPLSAQSQGLMIKDKLSEILKEFQDHSAITAGSCWSAMAKKLDVRTAQTPHGISSFRELVAEKDALVTHMRHPKTIDEYSQRLSAPDNSVPLSIFVRAFGIYDRTVDYVVCFCEHSALIMTTYKQSRDKHRKGIDRYSYECPNKMNAQEVVETLKQMRDSHQKMASDCVSRGFSRAMAAQKVLVMAAQAASATPQKSPPLEALKPLKGGSAATKLKSDHVDAARGAFQHNKNRQHEAAAIKEEKDSSAEAHLRTLSEGLPKDPLIRATAIRISLCQFHWRSNNCARDNCRFAHMSKAETAAVGITDDEITAALKVFNR